MHAFVGGRLAIRSPRLAPDPSTSGATRSTADTIRIDELTFLLTSCLKIVSIKRCLLSIISTHDEAEPVVVLQLFGQADKRIKSALQVRLPNGTIIFTTVTVICTFRTSSCQETIKIVPYISTLISFTSPSYAETRPGIFTYLLHGAESFLRS
jgi:hypothetical protein